jgi:hypothetical protein
MAVEIRGIGRCSKSDRRLHRCRDGSDRGYDSGRDCEIVVLVRRIKDLNDPASRNLAAIGLVTEMPVKERIETVSCKTGAVLRH